MLAGLLDVVVLVCCCPCVVALVGVANGVLLVVIAIALVAVLALVVFNVISGVVVLRVDLVDDVRLDSDVIVIIPIALS